MNSSIINLAKTVYRKLQQSKKDIQLCEKYVYGRSGLLDLGLVTVSVSHLGEVFEKNRFRKYTNEFNESLHKATEAKLYSRVSHLENFANIKEKIPVFANEVVGKVAQIDEFTFDAEILNVYRVKFGADVNEKSKESGNTKKYIRTFEFIPDGCSNIIFHTTGLGDNSICFMDGMSFVIEKAYLDTVNQKQNLTGFVFFDYLGTGMSGSLTNEGGDESFIEDATMIYHYIKKTYPDKKITPQANCLGCQVLARLISNLNLNCIKDGVSFESRHSISQILFCVPYTSAEELKREQYAITNICANVVLKSYRHCHLNKLNQFALCKFFPSNIDIIFIQARESMFRGKHTIFPIPNFIKNFFIRKDSDNFVPFEQSYRLAREIFKYNNLFYFYDKFSNHDFIIFLFWKERLKLSEKIFEIQKNNSQNQGEKIFIIGDLRVINLASKAKAFIEREAEKEVCKTPECKKALVEISDFLEILILTKGEVDVAFVAHKFDIKIQYLIDINHKKEDKFLLKLASDLRKLKSKFIESIETTEEIKHKILIKK